MALSDILAALVAIVAGAGMPNVTPYQPVSVTSAGAPAALKINGIIHFWSVTRDSEPRTRLTNVETEVHTICKIRGFYEIGDESVTEPLFQGKANTVADALGDFHTLAAPANVEILWPAQIVIFEPRKLVDLYLVHYVELSVDAQQLVRR